MVLYSISEAVGERKFPFAWGKKRMESWHTFVRKWFCSKEQKLRPLQQLYLPAQAEVGIKLPQSTPSAHNSMQPAGTTQRKARQRTPPYASSLQHHHPLRRRQRSHLRGWCWGEERALLSRWVLKEQRDGHAEKHFSKDEVRMRAPTCTFCRIWGHHCPLRNFPWTTQ